MKIMQASLMATSYYLHVENPDSGGGGGWSSRKFRLVTGYRIMSGIFTSGKVGPISVFNLVSDCEYMCL